MPLLKALTSKNLSLCCCINIVKRRPSPPPDRLHRPFPFTSSSWLPLYLRKLSILSLSTSTATAGDDDSTTHSSASTSDYEADAEDELSTLDFSSVYTSTRFFVSSPGLSNSILEDKAEEVAVQTESLDPYSDFRRSMEEMVEARELHDVLANWDSLRELLLRYLSLNPEHNHKFIAGAFADLLVSLMSSPPPPPSALGGVSQRRSCYQSSS